MAGIIVIGGNMAKLNRVTLEIGPKGKKVVAVAPDWPGLARGGRKKEEAIERLRSHMPRYAQVTKLAKMDAEFDAILGRIQAAGIPYRSSVRGPVDMKVNTDYGGRMVYWNEPDGHQWEILTVSYARNPNP